MRCFYTTPPPSVLPEQLASGSRRVSPEQPLNPGPPELLASGSRPVSRQSSSPVDPAEYPTRAAEQPTRAARAGAARQHLPVDPASTEQLASLVLLNVPLGAQLGLHFMLVPSCFECAPRLGKGAGAVSRLLCSFADCS